MSVVLELLASLPANEPPPRPTYEQQRRLRAAPAPSPSSATTSLDELPGIIDQAVRTYLSDPDPGRALLLALPPGAGKTTAMVHLAERVAASGHRVLYAGPRHDLFDDLMQISQRPTWWYHWLPRQVGDEHRPQTCRYAPQMERWLSRGYEAMAMCQNARICGYDYVNKHCPYHLQRQQREPIIYVQHQHVSVGHPMMTDCKLLIGDELPMSAFLRPWIIPPAEIDIPGAARDIEQLLFGIRNLTTIRPPDDQSNWCGVQLLDQLGGASYIQSLCAAYANVRPGIDIITPELRDANDVDRQPYNHLPYLLSMLEQEANAALEQSEYVQRILVSGEGMRLLMRRRSQELPRHIIWCDATGSARVYQQLLGMAIEEIRPVVPLVGRVFQIPASVNNRTAMTDEKLKRLRQQIDAIKTRGEYQAVSTITYKGTRELLQADGHFGAERGTNRYSQCDALIVIGTPQPPIPTIVQTAAMLFDTRMTPPFNVEWTTRDVVYEEQAWSMPVAGFWSDNDLQILLEQHREAELLQTVHRARPLRRAVDVWLLTSVPLPKLPVRLIHLQELFGAPPGVDIYRWQSVVQYADQQLNSAGILTSAQLALYASIQSAAARRWLTALAQQLPDAVLGRAPSSGRGQPPLALTRQRECKEFITPNTDLEP